MLNLYGAIRNRILKFIAHQKVIAKYTDSLNRGLVGQPVLVLAHVLLDKQTTELLDDF